MNIRHNTRKSSNSNKKEKEEVKTPEKTIQRKSERLKSSDFGKKNLFSKEKEKNSQTKNINEEFIKLDLSKYFSLF